MALLNSSESVNTATAKLKNRFNLAWQVVTVQLRLGSEDRRGTRSLQASLAL